MSKKEDCDLNCSCCGFVCSFNEDPILGEIAYKATDINKVINDVEEPKTGLRYNQGKAELSSVPTSIIYAIAKTLAYGAQKYAKNNWRKGMSWTTVYDCLQRHATKWLDGEECDEESGLPHIYHMAANVAMLVEFKGTCPEHDDRFKGKRFMPEDSFDFDFKKFIKEEK